MVFYPPVWFLPQGRVNMALGMAVDESGGAKGVADLRSILEYRTVVGVTIATPDHWHAPAARRCNRVVQHGTQSKSSEGIQAAMRLLQEGVIGDVLTAERSNWQKRKDIGHAQPSDPPGGVDYDAWDGPAEMMPYQPNRFHYDWHWWRNFGCGDIGNDGIHEVDLALWGLGVKTHPSTVMSVGAKYYFDDDQQFPDTPHVIFEFDVGDQVGDRRMLVFAQRLWSTNYPFNVESGVKFHGTKRGKFEILGEGNQPLNPPAIGAFNVPVAAHQQNWGNSIRSGGRPDSNIEIGHQAATAIHQTNISARLGRSLRFDPVPDQIVDDVAASTLIRRAYRDSGHWSVPTGNS